MKILILYASRNGSTQTCVERLCRQLHGFDVTVCRLGKETPKDDAYDAVVFGSSVRFGRLLPEARAYLKEHAEALCAKPLALFLCCGLAHEYEYYRETLFPKNVREAAFRTFYFGGSLKKDGLPFFDRLVVSKVRSAIVQSEIEDGEYTPTLPGLLPENVDRMAQALRETLFSGGEKIR